MDTLERPTLKELNKRVKKNAPHKWYDLGIELLEPEDIRELDAIQKNNPNDVGMCCTKMFQLWLDKQPDASWSHLLQALKEVDMDDLANKIAGDLSLASTGLTKTAELTSISTMNVLTAPVKFSRDENIANAFTKLSAAVTTVIQHTDFNRLQRACIERVRSPTMLHKSYEIIQNIQAAASFEGLCLMFSNTTYWNFLDIRIIEAMATASMIPAAQETIENFKKTFFSMTLQEAAPYFPIIQVEPNHTEVHEKLNRDPSQMTIGELHNHRFYLETKILKSGPDTCTICRIIIGSVVIEWQIHVDHVYQAYSRLKSLPSQFQLQVIHSISIPEAEAWEGLPFLWHGQDVDEIGPIESSPCVRQDPYPLPQGFEWSILTCSNIDEIIQLYSKSVIISRNYAKWIFSLPLYKKGYVMGVRLTASKKLVWLVNSLPYNIRVGGKVLPVIFLEQTAVNDQDVNKQLNQLNNAGIKEAMRIVGNEGIFQATMVDTNRVIPKVVFTYDTYSWDSQLNPLPYTTPRTVGLRRMKPTDVPKALALTNQYTSQFEIARVFQSEEEFLHWFLSPVLDDEQLTYVVEEPNNGNITDMFSCRCVDSMRDGVKKKIVAVIALVITKTPPKELITDLLLCVKQHNNFLVKLPQFGLDEHIFKDFFYHCDKKYGFFYNYKYPEINFNKCCIFGRL